MTYPWAAASALCPIRPSCSTHSFRRRSCCRWRRRFRAYFARLGEKKNRSRARIKFLVQDLGIEKFKELVLEERKTLSDDPRWTDFIEDAEKFAETPLRPGGPMPLLGSEAFQRWVKTNTRAQKQEGYTVVTIALPLGDITANQLRSLADIARRFTNETIRSTVEQNIVLRWISQSDLPGIAQSAAMPPTSAHPGAGSIVDIAACPGTDTCKLGISSSRGLAAELRKRLNEKNFQMDESIEKLHIKISGCFNSCGQHHVADLGFYGVSRKMSGYAVPHFQVVLGGEWENNGGFLWPAGHRHSVQENSGSRHATDGPLCGQPQERRKLQGFHRRIGQSRTEDDAGRSGAPAGRSQRSLALPGLGRSPRIHAGRYGNGRVRRRSRFFRRIRSGRGRKGIVRSPGSPGGSDRSSRPERPRIARWCWRPKPW